MWYSPAYLKFKKIIFGIWYLLRNPRLLHYVFEEGDFWRKYLKKQYQLPKGLPCIEIKEILPDFSVHLDKVAFLGGSSMPTDLALLKGLATTIPDCQFFEIGTWRGESVVNVAAAAKHCYTLNLSKAAIESMGLSSIYADLHGFFSKGKDNITHLEGNSMDYDFSQHPKMDLIFIDGDHQYRMVKNDTEKVFQHLVHDHTIVVWHDAAYHPEAMRMEVVAGVLDGLPAAARSRVYYVHNTMCAVYLPNSTPTHDFLEFPKRPTTAFEINIKHRQL